MDSNTEKIWAEHSGKLKMFVRSRVKDEDVVKDILQDVFLKVHLKIETLKSDTKTEQWLYQITRNTIIDYFRKAKENVDPEKIQIADEGVEPTNTSRFARCLSFFVSTLPEKYREAITLVELKNISQVELAAKLKISNSGAKSRVQRGKEMLKAKIEECCNVTSDRYGNILSHNPTCTTCGC